MPVPRCLTLKQPWLLVVAASQRMQARLEAIRARQSASGSSKLANAGEV